jgi:hypothetical protein
MNKYAYIYNVFLSCNGERTDISLDKFLDEIIPLAPEKRLKSLKYGDFLCKGMMPDTDPMKIQNRKIGFGKYRDRKPYEAEKGTDLAELINKDILEMSSALFIPEKFLCVIEYNHYGPKINTIAAYLNSYLPKTESEKWEIEFLPVESQLGWADISDSPDIKSIEIKLDISGKSRHFISKNDAPDSLLFQLIKNTVETHTEFGANNAKIMFSKGRKKDSQINKKQLLTLLELLELDSELFESVKIKYKSRTTKKTEEVDLKHAGIKSIKLENVDNTSNWEFICNELSTEYYSNHQPGSTEFNKYKPFKSKNLPDIIK